MKIFLSIFTFTITLQVFSQSFNIQERIEAKNLYRNYYSSVFGKSQFALLGEFKKNILKLDISKKKDVAYLVENLSGVLPSKFLRPLIHWKVIEPNNKKLIETLNFIMIYKSFILRDAIQSPLSLKTTILEAKKLAKEIHHRDDISANNILEVLKEDFTQKATLITGLKELNTFTTAIIETDALSYTLPKTSTITPYTLSFSGFIPGNHVELISENNHSEERIQWYNERAIFNGGVLDFSSEYIHMPSNKFASGHIAFKSDPIFIKIRDMISDSRESILIDIFLFGGTIGATIAEYLLDQVKLKMAVNSKFKVLILHDFANNYNMKEELMPIFKYIKSRIENEKDLNKSVYLLQSNIQRHPPGIPFSLTKSIPRTSETFKIVEKKNTYYESKVDHSKVIVIDGNSENPQAYFGSKNWTDHSGGYYYDNAIWVHGPAAAMVQNSYLDDIKAALTEDPEELKQFFLQEEGFDNKRYLPIKESIIESFKITRKHYPHVGNQTIRMAEADVDGKVKNTRNILIDMIKQAKSHIYMEQLFLYDPYIINALIKRKIEMPDLKIKILADHNSNFGMNGLPNTIFLRELKIYGIEIKARKSFSSLAVFPNGVEINYHQENHRKITSVDGLVLLGGSSNLNPETLQGSFREFGAQIYDERAIRSFETNFLVSWNDRSQTMDLDVENFEARIGKDSISKDISSLINAIATKILKAKDQLERRF
ncbi:hypothetical protein A9Q84_08040 [Halobacteriovorax marinus]|uniref:PLD phosphodiesterase domain-containing protein n=1 Tax=Halobacteriovorax marinus TaxID=97084 RepID=A0A1Y5F5X8_9BACT|nr:hypothetical protein A9Q84_08040 [Halobacteriovorax marinus]